jgi:son of sevenless-like protein
MTAGGSDLSPPGPPGSPPPSEAPCDPSADGRPRAPSAPNQEADDFEEAQSCWMTDLLLEHPEVLAMRERTLPGGPGHSFANVAHTQKVISPEVLNRHSLLELVYSHLESIGMYGTAAVLSAECGRTFARAPEAWTRTDLRVLVSLAVGARDGIWDAFADPDQQYVLEMCDRDYFASPYREDPTTIAQELYDPHWHVFYDRQDPQGLMHIKACSLKRLVVYFASCVNQDMGEQEMFFLTLHSITSACHFLEHLVQLYDVEIDDRRTHGQSARTIRFNIVNIIKKWVTSDPGKRALDRIAQFCDRIEADDQLPGVEKHIEVIRREISRCVSGKKPKPLNLDSCPPPVIPHPQVLFKQNLTLLEPDPMEVARQITLIYHQRYASIKPHEFIRGLSMRKTDVGTPTLAAFFLFRDSMSSLVAETFLSGDPASRRGAYERLCEIAACLLSPELMNVEAASCILRFLLRPDVRVLGSASARRSEELAARWRDCGEEDRHAPSHPTPYEVCMDNQFHGWKPMIPNMRVQLKAGDKAAASESNMIGELINWGKIYPFAMCCVVLHRFQTLEYRLVPMSQIQKIILRGPTMTAIAIEAKIDQLTRIAMRTKK